MGRYIFILLLLAAIPWGIKTWWQMRCAKSARERAFLGRASTGVAMGSVLTALAFVMLSMRGQLFALPLVVVAGLTIRHGWRKARARIQAEESDPVSRAKPLN